MAYIHPSVTNGNDVIDIDNSYIENAKKTVFTATKNGTINVRNSEIRGNLGVESGAKLNVNNSKIIGAGGNVVGIKGVGASGETPATISAITLKGNSVITGGNGIRFENQYAEIVLDNNFTGNIEIHNDNNGVGYVKGAEGFTALNSVKSITKAGTSGATFAYYDATTGKFGWTAAPVLTGKTDAGIYEDGTGVIRFLTTFTTAPATAAIENYGTYAIGVSNFTGDPESITKFVKFDTAPTKDGQAFIVDVVNIPSEKLDTNITAISFVKLKGIATPVYLNYDAVNVESAADGGGVKNLVKEA